MLWAKSEHIGMSLLCVSTPPPPPVSRCPQISRAHSQHHNFSVVTQRSRSFFFIGSAWVAPLLFLGLRPISHLSMTFQMSEQNWPSRTCPNIRNNWILASHYNWTCSDILLTAVKTLFCSARERHALEKFFVACRCISIGNFSAKQWLQRLFEGAFPRSAALQGNDLVVQTHWTAWFGNSDHGAVHNISGSLRGRILLVPEVFQ